MQFSLFLTTIITVNAVLIFNKSAYSTDILSSLQLDPLAICITAFYSFPKNQLTYDRGSFETSKMVDHMGSGINHE